MSARRAETVHRHHWLTPQRPGARRQPRCQNSQVFTLQAPIATERLVLRPYRRGDAADLHDIQSRPEVMRYLYDEVRTLEEVEGLVEKRITHDEPESRTTTCSCWPQSAGTTAA